MKRLLALVLTSILVVWLIAGCGGVETYTDTEKTIITSIEQEFVIALDSNPTTGYDWEEKHDLYKLILIEKKYEPDEKAAGLVGAGGTQYFRFTSQKTGETEITFTYKRPWEEPTSQDVTKVFKVDIKGGLFTK
ncbi:protease inhibitor I42 family protein [Chloroflexota bacterium]